MISFCNACCGNFVASSIIIIFSRRYHTTEFYFSTFLLFGIRQLVRYRSGFQVPVRPISGCAFAFQLP
jgi:hypothetical protein